MKDTKNIVISKDPVTRTGGLTVTEVPKTIVDRFVEEYGDDWPLELVRIGADGYGKTLDIYVIEEKATEFRVACPSLYGEERMSTIVIGCAHGQFSEE